jgi:hypothetical protein
MCSLLGLMTLIDCSQEFDPIKYILENIPDEGGHVTYFDNQVGGGHAFLVHVTLTCMSVR